MPRGQFKDSSFEMQRGKAGKMYTSVFSGRSLRQKICSRANPSCTSRQEAYVEETSCYCGTHPQRPGSKIGRSHMSRLSKRSHTDITPSTLLLHRLHACRVFLGSLSARLCRTAGNGEADLHRMHCLMKQSVAGALDHRVIIFENDSTDKTCCVMQQLCATDKRTLCLNSHNMSAMQSGSSSLNLCESPRAYPSLPPPAFPTGVTHCLVFVDFDKKTGW